MRHLIDILDFSSDEIDSLIKTADDIINNPDLYAKRCKRKIRRRIFTNENSGNI